MAKKPSEQQRIVKEAILGGLKEDRKAVAEFLRANQDEVMRLGELREDRFERLTDWLEDGTPHQISVANAFLEKILEKPQHIKVRDLRLSKIVRQALASRESRRTSEFLQKKQYLRATINSWGSVMTSWGVNEQQRDAVAVGFFGPFLASMTPIVAGMVMNAFMIGGSQAALPETPIIPEATAYEHNEGVADIIGDELHIEDNALAYAAPPTFSHPAFDGFNQSSLPLSNRFNPEMVDGLNIQADGSISYRQWTVPQEVYDANARTIAVTNFPADLLYALHAAESSFIPDNFNKDSSACGLGQFVPSTFYEKVFNYAELAGYPEAKSLVKRYVVSTDEHKRNTYGYRPLNADAKQQLVDLCMDPDINSRLTAIYATRTIGSMQRNLQHLAPAGADYFPLTQGQYYAAYFSGQHRAERMIANLAEQGGTRDAHMYFDKQATDLNENVLFVDGERDKPRTVAQFFDYMTAYKGLGSETLPDMRDWGSKREAIMQAVVAENTPRLAHTPTPQAANTL